MSTRESRDIFPQSSYAGLSGEVHGSVDSRPPLVLLHQLGCNRAIWASCLNSLAEIDAQRRYLTIDLPGHGTSPNNLPHTTGHLAQLINQAVHEAGFDSPVIVGHWTSSHIAHTYAAHYSVRGVISVDPFPAPAHISELLQSQKDTEPSASIEKVWEQITAKFETDLLPSHARDIIKSTCKPEPAVIASYWQEFLDRPPEELHRRMVTDSLSIGSKGISYLIITGRLSRTERVRLAEMLPTAVVEVWHRGSHFPYLAFPDRFARRLSETGSWELSR